MALNDEAERPRLVLLFDGECNLCSGVVRWVIARDRRARFRFASLSSSAAKCLAGEAAKQSESVILIDGDRVLVGSDAVLGIARRLGWPWSLFSGLRVLPRCLRDPLYGFIARRRYRWFGRRESCMTPTPELRGRFLD